MPRVRHFYATIFSAIGRDERDPLGSYDDDAGCLGLGRHCCMKLEAKGQHVESIRFDLRSDRPDDGAALRRAIEAIDRLVPSLIADYFMDAEVPVADAALLDRYFAHLTA